VGLGLRDRGRPRSPVGAGARSWVPPARDAYGHGGVAYLMLWANLAMTSAEMVLRSLSCPERLSVAGSSERFGEYGMVRTYTMHAYAEHGARRTGGTSWPPEGAGSG